MATPCSDNCDNSCEALNGLYEKAVNLIAYSDLIKSWVNGPKTGTVNIAGTNVPTLLNLATTLKTNSDAVIANTQSRADTLITNLQNRINGLPSSIIASGGGVGLDSNGKLVIDFSAMPTDKFEAMLKSIRVPIWLSGTMNLYVANNGVDNSNESGRGFSAAKPFKTIQYAVNFIDDNYNLSRFNAVINLAAGTYDLTSAVSLGGYSTNTGSIIIQGAALDASNKPTSFIRTTNHAAFTLAKSVNYTLRNLGFIFNVTPDITKYTSFLTCSDGTLSVDGFDFKINVSGFTSSSSSASVRFLYAGTAGTLILSNSTDLACSIAITGNTSTISAKTISSILSIYSGGSLRINGSTTASRSTVSCTGNVSLFALCTGGSIATNSAYDDRMLKFSGSSFTGKRYSAQNGGHISVGGAATPATYFPGDVAGTADASTFSFYN